MLEALTKVDSRPTYTVTVGDSRLCTEPLDIVSKGKDI